jgi:imidazolonepropionase-like amidohydrolase
MAAGGAAWTPTFGAMLDPRDDDTDVRRLRVAGTTERLRTLVPLARRLGVPVLTGSDVVGSVPGEVAWLVRLGLDPTEALGAATSTARAFLGVPDVLAGGPADLVTYDADPRDDPDVLARPAAVVHDGRRLA